jgi:hypothetical protein
MCASNRAIIKAKAHPEDSAIHAPILENVPYFLHYSEGPRLRVGLTRGSWGSARGWPGTSLHITPRLGNLGGERGSRGTGSTPGFN